MSKRRILVTGALPYASGPIHIGHMVEAVQADVWARFQRLRGHECIFICGDDSHGTAIMIRAEHEKTSPEDLVHAMRDAHLRDFQAFDISFDQYGDTNVPENRAVCHEIWEKICDAGMVETRDVTQLYDPKAGLFLADRFVRGTCPKCETPDQYGDSCDSCGSTYAATDLKNPRSTMTDATPETRTHPHVFVKIEHLRSFLDEWVATEPHVGGEQKNYLRGQFLSGPLRDWDVSRPAPYFGFEIPTAPGNYWYVWFTAPNGYIANTKIWCDKHGQPLERWWKDDSAEIYHFIGKDIVYFHCLFWPAVLKTAGFNLPTRVQIHGMLTVDGGKMSKTKGTSIPAATYAEHLDPTYLRYFYASKLGVGADDFDLGLDEFVAKVNSDLVGKVVNIASRTAKFIKDVGLSESYPEDGGLFAKGALAASEIADAYEACDYQKAVKLVMALADRANEFVEAREPWALRKDESKARELQDVCTVALNLFRQIITYLTPITPRLTAKSDELFGEATTDWNQALMPLLGVKLRPFKHLLARMDRADLDRVVAASVVAPPSPAAVAKSEAEDPLEDEINIDTFLKTDLRVARVIEAAHVPKANALLQLKLDLGPLGERTVFAGIKKAYELKDLEGRLVVCVANLASRKMKFGVSEGMVLAAGPGGSDIYVLGVDSGATPGQRVR